MWQQHSTHIPTILIAELAQQQARPQENALPDADTSNLLHATCQNYSTKAANLANATFTKPAHSHHAQPLAAHVLSMPFFELGKHAIHGFTGFFGKALRLNHFFHAGIFQKSGLVIDNFRLDKLFGQLVGHRVSHGIG